MEKPLQVFCCYAREDQPFLLTLEKHLRPLQRAGLIIVQADIDVSPGEEWEQKISHYLNTAQIILLLISSDFMDSDYCYSKEMTRAMQRHERGEARVIPILLRPTHWHLAPFRKLQVLPANAKSVTSKHWHTPDDAFFDVTKGIEKAVEELIAQSQAEIPPVQQIHTTLDNTLDSSAIARDTTDGSKYQTLGENSMLTLPGGGLSEQMPEEQHTPPVPPPASRAREEDLSAETDHVFAPTAGPRVDWGNALDVPTFYGRKPELATLAQWVLQERCRVVSVLGMGGIGKSALVTSAMYQVAEHFQVVLFRSLRDAPSCETLLEECLQVLAPQQLGLVPADLEGRLGLLLEHLRRTRVLLVLDNLETLLSEGEARGHLRPGFEGYARLLRRVAGTAHQSCLLLTSREKPAELRALEGRRSPVRSLRLVGLDAAACDQLLADNEVVGSQEEQARLIERYAGNPLALKIVADTIADLFGGEIGPFLEEDTLVFGSIADLLDEQVVRLSALEQTVLCWLAIVREPVTLEELHAVLIEPLPRGQVLEAVDGLRRRSLVERGQRQSSFTLQSVVLEYVSARIVAEVASEIEQGRLWRLIQHGLCQAHAKEYVRLTQERLLVAPLLSRLQSTSQGQANVEERVCSLLDQLRERAQDAQGYGPANLVALLRVLRGDLRGLDLSRLALRGVHLQGVEMQDATFSGALIQDSVFTETFEAITAVAISSTGQSWAAGSRRGEVRVWEAGGQTLHLVWQAHTDVVWTLTFSPDGRSLASVSYDGGIKLWEVASGALLWTGWHMNFIHSVAFAPDASMLASGGHDAAVKLWDLQRGTYLQTLPHPSPIVSVAWSPDGHLLASGDFDGCIRLWEIQKTQPATCVHMRAGHTNSVTGLAFAPDGSTLASGSWDGTVKLWEIESLRCLQTLLGHTDQVNRVAWSPDGLTLASGSHDKTILL